MYCCFSVIVSGVLSSQVPSRSHFSLKEKAKSLLYLMAVWVVRGQRLFPS